MHEIEISLTTKELILLIAYEDKIRDKRTG